MKIFLSYASPDRALVEPIHLALAAQKHDVFFDREDLPPGEEFDTRIRKAIADCDLFVCFLSPETLDGGSYTLNEIDMASKKWAHPSGHVLPVLLKSVPFAQIPTYLKSVTVLETSGNLTAAVGDAVHRLDAMHRRQRLRKAGLWTLLLLVPAAAGAAYWFGRSDALVGKDGAPYVRLPAGNAVLGDGEWWPLRNVYTDAFYIDTFEITVARYAKFLEATGGLVPPDYWDEVDVERDGQLPVVGVSWHDANAYCRWAGRRLPTDAEWEKAARASDARRYPWGNDAPTPERAVYAREADAPYKGGVAPVGTHPAGQSALGVQDLAGNVSEWAADWYASSFSTAEARNPTGPPSGEGRVIRGSTWHDPAERLDASWRYSGDPNLRLDEMGFRCAMDAPPE